VKIKLTNSSWYVFCQKHLDIVKIEYSGTPKELDKEEVIKTCEFKGCKKEPMFEFYPEGVRE